MSRLPNAFYLDDPQDGVSVHLLKSLGVEITSAADLKPAPLSNALPVDTHSEYGLDVAATYSLSPEDAHCGAFIDIRDSADAWIRIVLSPDSACVLADRVHRRVPAAGTPLVAPSLAAVASSAGLKEVRNWGSLLVSTLAGGALPAPRLRFVPGSAAEETSNVAHFAKAENPHTRDIVVNLCASFYHLGWVTGTGGSISIRHGDRIFMAPSGVQKERMRPQDIFVLDTSGAIIGAPTPLPGKPQLKLSQCAPLFQHAFNLRRAGACIHTHDISAVMCTLQNETEWTVTHQEMIKGIAGHGFLDKCVVPIIENTPHECDLADSLGVAMERYPKSNAVLVRRHGVYVWGDTWEAAKTQAECYHYLFDASVRMRGIGINPAEVPKRITSGIGADTSYGTAGARDSTTATAAASSPSSSSSTSSAGACYSSDGQHHHTEFGGVAGVHSQLQHQTAQQEQQQPSGPPLCLADVEDVMLDIEGTTTSIAFVTEVLFPFAAAELRRHCDTAWGTPEFEADAAQLVQQSVQDVEAGVPGAVEVALTSSASLASMSKLDAVDAIVRNVLWQMSTNRKTGALKALQGHIWRSGYVSGKLKGHVYPDTPAALRAWVGAGKRVYIYSSGSREAQRLLFKHSKAGDLRNLLSGYFDTSVGPKVSPSSYADIALTLGVDDPSKVLFLTDAIAEARAASSAGMQVALTVRPGNVPLPEGHGFAVVESLLELV